MVSDESAYRWICELLPPNLFQWPAYLHMHADSALREYSCSVVATTFGLLRLTYWVPNVSGSVPTQKGLRCVMCCYSQKRSHYIHLARMHSDSWILKSAPWCIERHVYPIKLNIHWHGAAQDYVLQLHMAPYIVAPALIYGEVQDYSSQSDNVGWCSVAVGAWVGQHSWHIRLYTQSSWCLQRAARNLARALAIFDHCRRIRLPREGQQWHLLQKALDVWAHLWTKGWPSLLYQYSPIGFFDRLKPWNITQIQTQTSCREWLWVPLSGFTRVYRNGRLTYILVHQCTTWCTTHHGTLVSACTVDSFKFYSVQFFTERCTYFGPNSVLA